MFFGKHFQKSAVKHSIEKPIWLKFVNLSATFCSKLILKATQLQKIPEYDTFEKAHFCTLASSMNLGLNAVPGGAGQYL